jgi:hypothetical protein
VAGLKPIEVGPRLHPSETDLRGGLGRKQIFSLFISTLRSYPPPLILVFYVVLKVLSDYISNFDLSAMHPSFYLRAVPFISSLAAVAVC